MNQPSNNSMASGHGDADTAHSAGVPAGPYHAPGGSYWASGGHVSGSGGSGSDGSWKQIAPEDAPAWCYKLHIANSQVRSAQVTIALHTCSATHIPTMHLQQ